ncbi:MAG: alcohol dehydrogenase catalytic domain-containing protein [Candidatus Thermoplasmatota archaeon]|nr:alcohol dehydrogenase catalytic domain-containing protein [Candidatus Thermoplasmatota archaeon]
MKAIVIRQPGGLENTRVEDVDKPKSPITIRVTYAGLNPVDVNVILGKVNYNITPYPHIPGAEFVGVVEGVTSSKKFKVGDRVVVYPRVYDGSCERCRAGSEELCRTGGVTGVASNGGFSEFFGTDDEHLEKIPDSMSFEDAVSIPVGGLTAYHALSRVGLKSGERLLVIGASGNTGWYSLILGKLKGARTFYVSRKKWVAESGAAEWNKEKVDVIVNSLGSAAWETYMDYLDTGGRVVTFGTLTGREAKLNLAHLYTGERSIIGSTGGTRKEFPELIRLISENKLKSRVWKVFEMSDYENAIKEYENRDGRILLKF